MKQEKEEEKEEKERRTEEQEAEDKEEKDPLRHLSKHTAELAEDCTPMSEHLL